METPIEHPLVLILLPALTLVFFVSPMTGESMYRGALFRETTTSKCLTDQNETTKNAESTPECAAFCMSYDECQYFSYSNGACYMHRWFLDGEIEEYDCDRPSYLLFSESKTEWQKVFEMTENSFKKSPIYLYWDKLPIEKVELRLKRESAEDVLFFFNGTETNSTSWFQKDKFFPNLSHSMEPLIMTFNANFSYPNFTIVYTDVVRVEVRRQTGYNEKYEIHMNFG
ncbi:uncharacterized protein LOC118760963, partial [Octopus sinensis]|uniref:Uncharacterized protein LOC118760963 n=1 Tax=Octopus sinensis TaxID=2607531 RepID=A0A7E6EHX6_9MOLL